MSLLVGSRTLLTYTHQFLMQNSFSEWSHKHCSYTPLNTCLNILVSWCSIQFQVFSCKHPQWRKSLQCHSNKNYQLILGHLSETAKSFILLQPAVSEHKEFMLHVFVASNKYSGFLYIQVRFQRLEIITCSPLSGPGISEMQLDTMPYTLIFWILKSKTNHGPNSVIWFIAQD